MNKEAVYMKQRKEKQGDKKDIVINQAVESRFREQKSKYKSNIKNRSRV